MNAFQHHIKIGQPIALEEISHLTKWVPASIGVQVTARRMPQLQKGLLLGVCLAHFLGLWLLWSENELPAQPLEAIPLTVSLLAEPTEAAIVSPQVTAQPQSLQTPRSQPHVFNTPKPVQTESTTPPVVTTPSTIVANTPSTPTQESITRAVSESSETSPKSVSDTARDTIPNETEKALVNDEVVEPPKFGVAYLNNPKPDYPRSSRRAGEQGRALFRVLVNEQGNPDSVELIKSTGYERLDQSALEAVQKWRFIPAKKNNVPISAYVTVPIHFSLD